MSFLSGRKSNAEPISGVPDPTGVSVLWDALMAGRLLMFGERSIWAVFFDDGESSTDTGESDQLGACAEIQED